MLMKLERLVHTRARCAVHSNKNCPYRLGSMPRRIPIAFDLALYPHPSNPMMLSLIHI